MKKYALAFMAGLAMVAVSASADTTLQNVQVTQIGTYPSQPYHFVWFSAPAPAECTSGPRVLVFAEDVQTAPGGKAMLAMLMTALTANRKVDVRVSGCNIAEVYLK